MKDETCELNVPAADVWVVTSSFVTLAVKLSVRVSLSYYFAKISHGLAYFELTAALKGFMNAISHRCPAFNIFGNLISAQI